MGSNLENDRTVTSGKMYPIDLAPQKITIVKSVANSEVKMAHLLPGQPKTTATGQIITHTGPIGLMRAGTQILSTGVASQPQVLMSGTPLLQGPQIVSQGSQIISQGQQIISQPQLISSQLLNQSTQIISQGTQGNPGNINPGTQISAAPTSTQVLNVSGQLVSGTGNLVVSSSVRALSPNVRVLPPLPHHNTRPVAIQNATASVVVSKAITSHVPRGPVAGASLAVPRVAARPITPSSATMPISSLGTSWPSAPRVRSSLVYSARAPTPRVAGPRVLPAPAHSAVVTLPNTTVLTSTSVITTGVRGPSPRPMPTPAPTVSVSLTAQRPIPLVQRNCPTAKVVGVANVGMRGVGNSAPSQLYYEVSRPATPVVTPAQHVTPLPARVLTPYTHVPQPNTQVNVANTVQVLPEGRLPTASVLATSILPRPSILRKRDIEGSPTKVTSVTPVNPPIFEMRHEDSELGNATNLHRPTSPAGSGGGSGGGSTTESAASSPGPDDEPPSPPRAPSPQDISPRKKPRKQMLSSSVRHCEFSSVERQRTPPPAPILPLKRPLLSSSFVCGWRATALHFTRPADVRRREPRAAELPAIAAQPNVLTAAQGWKVHHLTAQMDELVSLEADASEQLSHLLRSLEGVHGRAQTALAPHSHTLLELVKGNIQRSQIVCEGIRESREDILRVFTHQTFVGDILKRQGDKRSFRKHRSQS